VCSIEYAKVVYSRVNYHAEATEKQDRSLHLWWKLTIWTWDLPLFDFVIDATHMFAAPVWSALLPIGTGTGLPDDIDFVSISGRRFDFVATTLGE
jgi:hypothetical protein